MIAVLKTNYNICIELTISIWQYCEDNDRLSNCESKKKEKNFLEIAQYLLDFNVILNV